MMNIRIVFSLLLLLYASWVTAQVQQFQIEYQVEIEGLDQSDGDQAMAAAMMQDMNMTLSFREGVSRVDMDASMMQMKTISDAEAQRTVVLTQVMGRKMAQVYEGEDFDQAQQQQDQEVEVRKTDETKRIAGYLCHQAFVSTADSDGEFEIWYTKELLPTQNTSAYGYEGIEGFPLEMYVEQQEMTMHMIAARVNTETLPADYFSTEVPEGYTIRK